MTTDTDLAEGPAHDPAADVYADLDADLLAVAEQIWASLLQQEDVVGAPGTLRDGDCWTAAVTVDGPARALVAVATTHAGAAALARYLLQLDEASTDDLVDALGELANVLGGNVKSMLAGPASLSLPVVTRGIVAAPSHHLTHAGLDATWAGHAVRLDTWVVDSSKDHRP